MLVRALLGGLVVVVAVIALGLSGVLDRSARDDQAAAAQPPIVDCDTHVEPGLKRFDAARDTIRGPFAVITTARDVARRPASSFRPRRGRLQGAKLPVGLRAGSRATLRVSPAQRAHAALLFRAQTRDASRIADGDQAVTFDPCAPDTPAFSGGTVGPITGWAGALIVTGPRCVRLQLRVDGRRQPDILLPLGRRCPQLAGARPGLRTAGCANRSMADFPAAFSRPQNLIVGPVVFVALLAARSSRPTEIRRFGGWKSPLLVKNGRSATVTITPASRSVARLDYSPADDRGHRRFRDLPHTMRFLGCAADERSGSTADNIPVTFWSGAFALRRPSCVSVRIVADGEPAVTRRVGFGRQRC